jgi:hypothetical protein
MITTFQEDSPIDLSQFPVSMSSDKFPRWLQKALEYSVKQKAETVLVSALLERKRGMRQVIEKGAKSLYYWAFLQIFLSLSITENHRFCLPSHNIFHKNIQKSESTLVLHKRKAGTIWLSSKEYKDTV